MPHAVSIADPGLQALILCGPGSSFPTFTTNPDENPKALLPIANRPMVWYAIDFCYRSGITDITLICPPSTVNAITAGLNTNPFLTSLPSPRPDLLAPQDLDYNTSTADILRLPEVKKIVKRDFLVLSCDIVCELAGGKLLQAWMVKSANLARILGASRSLDSGQSGGLGVWYDTKTTAPAKGQETDFIAVTPLPTPAAPPPKGSLLPQLSKLVLSMPTDSLKDVVEEKSGLPIRHGLIRRHPRVRMLTTHRDAHIYIFPRWVMDFIDRNEGLESIGEDVIGWWAKAGWQHGLSEKLGIQQIFEGSDAHDDTMVTTPERQQSPRAASGTKNTASAAESTPQQHKTSLRPAETPKQTAPGVASKAGSKADAPLRKAEGSDGAVPDIMAYIHPSESSAPLVCRVDTGKLLLAVSLLLAKLPSVEEVGSWEAASPLAHMRKVAYPEGVAPRTTITRQDSLVADNVTVEEKASIRESVVGANCQVREGAKLQQCLLMDGVVVGRNCRLTRCVLGKRCEIGDGSVLTDCEVQENLLVEPASQETKTNLMSSAGLEASEAEMQEALQEDGDDASRSDQGGSRLASRG